MSENQQNTTPSFELPSGTSKPIGELPVPEAAPRSPEQGASPPVPAIPASLPSDNAVDPVAQAISSATKTSSGSGASSNDSPLIADDVDVLEKEWVRKAKKIVEETHDDPRKQKQRLSEFKADYMKKRYNKDIKLED